MPRRATCDCWFSPQDSVLHDLPSWLPQTSKVSHGWNRGIFRTHETTWNQDETSWNHEDLPWLLNIVERSKGPRDLAMVLLCHAWFLHHPETWKFGTFGKMPKTASLQRTVIGDQRTLQDSHFLWWVSRRKNNSWVANLSIKVEGGRRYYDKTTGLCQDYKKHPDTSLSHFWIERIRWKFLANSTTWATSPEWVLQKHQILSGSMIKK